jgi:hypothetical protein
LLPHQWGALVVVVVAGAGAAAGAGGERGLDLLREGAGEGLEQLAGAFEVVVLLFGL